TRPSRPTAAAPAALAWGVDRAPDRDGHWSVSFGAFLDISGKVDETFRAYYKATGQNSKQALAESYDLGDFGVDPPYGAFGLHYARQWRFFAFRFDVEGFSLSADAHAKRDYYIGLGDDVRYGGRKFDHMKIPAGSAFSADFSGGLLDAVASFTPVEIELSENVRLVPSLDFGLAVFGGEWKVDAGPARGTAVYQNPPVDFVVGGSSSSFVGAGAPFAGASLEIRVGSEDWVQWVTRAGFGLFSYDGSTRQFAGKGREKDLDLDYLSATLDTCVLLPMTEGTCLSLGARLRYMSIDAEITSKERDAAAIVAARERFDKSADFDALLGEFYVGVTF
ncbi:MAG: hypothetical protein IJ783_01035, partial [Kiritimatiellae bacterium]|nr:hypothetical protein [Kiritimatiellia bacterium]